MIWKTAWKNVWRNRIRSLVVISSVTIGIFAGVFSIALMNGMIDQRVDDALSEEISDIQVTARDFRVNNDPALTIVDPLKVRKEISSVNGVSAIVDRTIINGMANTAYKSTGVQITGIDPAEEKNVFTLYKKLIPGTGSYFEADSKINPALIGEALAKDLNIVRFVIDSLTLSRLRKEGVPSGITDKLEKLYAVRFVNEKQFLKKMKSVFTAAEEKKYGQEIRNAAWSFREGSKLTLTFLDRGNNQVSAAFRLIGLFKVSNSVYEKTTVFVKKADLQKLLGFPENTVHQYIIRINDLGQTDRITNELADRLKELEVVSWKKISPELAMMTDMVQQFYLIFGLIILSALAFGIINTMLMVVLERTRELGMLTAIGMNKKKVFSMIMLESVFLSLTGGVAGMILSFLVVKLTMHTGINLSQYAEGFGAMGYAAIVYPQISAGFFIVVTILIILTGVVSSIYPALKALKLNPVEAIRTE